LGFRQADRQDAISAITTKLPVMRLRKRVAFERFLAKLGAAEPGNWVLKGAFALELRLGVRAGLPALKMDGRPSPPVRPPFPR
jgi:hypothetical protein